MGAVAGAFPAGRRRARRARLAGHSRHCRGGPRNPDSIADHGIEDVTRHYASIIDGLPGRPILVGHSFGGMIAEKLLGEDYGAAAVAIDAAQIKGVLPLPLSALRSTLPVFKNPANIHKAVSLTAEQFRYSFGNAISETESGDLHERWSIPAPGRPLFEAATANFSLHSPDKVQTRNEDRGPLLLVMGGQDHTVPEAITKSTLKQYRHSDAVTDLEEFSDRGHSLTIDARLASGGRAVPDLAEQARPLGAAGPAPGGPGRRRPFHRAVRWDRSTCTC